MSSLAMCQNTTGLFPHSLWTTHCMDDVSARFGDRNGAGMGGGGGAQGLVLL